MDGTVSFLSSESSAQIHHTSPCVRNNMVKYVWYCLLKLSAAIVLTTTTVFISAMLSGPSGRTVSSVDLMSVDSTLWEPRKNQEPSINWNSGLAVESFSSNLRWEGCIPSVRILRNAMRKRPIVKSSSVLDCFEAWNGRLQLLVSSTSTNS